MERSGLSTLGLQRWYSSSSCPTFGTIALWPLLTLVNVYNDLVVFTRIDGTS